jgi:hypothetical protein
MEHSTEPLIPKKTHRRRLSIEPNRSPRGMISRRKSEKYNEFTTIDWLKDWIKDYDSNSDICPQTLLLRAMAGIQTWALLALTGISIGSLTAVLDIVTAYVSDL